MTENIKVFTQNSIRIKSSKGMIYIDPFRMEDAPKDAAFIMITHDHYDHYSPEDIEKVAGDDTVLIVPKKMEDKGKSLAAVSRVVTVEPGIHSEVDGLEFETVPSYNILKPFHPKSAGWVGYILLIEGKRIYIAGDTDATKEAKEVKCDIALIPVGGTYTMDTKKAAELVNEIRPQVAIPVHYGSVAGKPTDGETFASLVQAPVEVEIKLERV